MWHTHAQGLVRQIATHPREFTLVGAHDPDPVLAAQRRLAWASLVPGMVTFDTPEALIAEGLDAVAVEGQVWDNLRLAGLAVEANLSVLLEKPAGEDLAGFRRLLDDARERHVHVQMSYLFRSMAAVSEMLRRTRRGDLGHIYEFRGRLPKDLALYDEHEAELGRYAGGIFFEMAGHLIDLAVAILGVPQRVTPFLRHHHQVDLPFIDHGVAVLEYERAMAIIQVPALETATQTRRIEVFGTRGVLVIPHLGSGHLKNNEKQPLDVYSAESGEWELLDLLAIPLQISDLREFAAVIAGKKSPDFGPAHDLAVQRILVEACNAGG